MISLRKTTALLLILLFYFVAIGIAILTVKAMSIENPFYQVLFADLIATLIIFIFSFISKNSSVYDPYWSVIPPLIIAWFVMLYPEGNTVRQLIVFLLVLFWSVRLTANWARGWKGFSHEDWRYVKLAKDTKTWYWLVSFTGIHLFPTLIVFLGCIPLFYILPSQNTLGMMDITASIICFGAILIEWRADEQLKKFKKKAEQGSYINTGLWHISRHPNYMGEILFWFGLFVFVPALGDIKEDLISSTGFIAMLLLFRFVSIPMMEKRNLVNKKGYDKYIKSVSMIFPRKLS